MPCALCAGLCIHAASFVVDVIFRDYATLKGWRIVYAFDVWRQGIERYKLLDKNGSIYACKEQPQPIAEGTLGGFPHPLNPPTVSNVEPKYESSYGFIPGSNI